MNKSSLTISAFVLCVGYLWSAAPPVPLSPEPPPASKKIKVKAQSPKPKMTPIERASQIEMYERSLQKLRRQRNFAAHPLYTEYTRRLLRLRSEE